MKKEEKWLRRIVYKRFISSGKSNTICFIARRCAANVKESMWTVVRGSYSFARWVRMEIENWNRKGIANYMKSNWYKWKIIFKRISKKAFIAKYGYQSIYIHAYCDACVRVKGQYFHPNSRIKNLSHDGYLSEVCWRFIRGATMKNLLVSWFNAQTAEPGRTHI